MNKKCEYLGCEKDAVASVECNVGKTKVNYYSCLDHQTEISKETEIKGSYRVSTDLKPFDSSK